MMHWTAELHALLLEITGMMNRPDIDEGFLAAVEPGRTLGLERALFPLLSRIGVLGPVSIVRLASEVGRDHSTISRQIAKLEARGLVERFADHGDGRVRLLRPSTAGREMIAAFARTRQRLMEAQFSDWSEAQRTALITLLRKMVREASMPQGMGSVSVTP